MIYVQLVALGHDRVVHHALVEHLLHVIQLYAVAEAVSCAVFDSALVKLRKFFIAVSFLYDFLVVVLSCVERCLHAPFKHVS
jgi:hypothetical protein